MRKRTLRYVLALIVLSLLLPISAYAASLTDAQVRKFVSSWSDVTTLLDDAYDESEDAYGDDFDAHHDDDLSPSTMMSDMVEQIRGQAVYSQLRRLVRQHGFSGVDEWAQVGDRVMRAAFAIQLGDHAATMEEEMTRALKDIDENPHLTEEMKQDMKAAMAQSVAAMAELAATPEADKNAVLPHMDELEQMWGHDDEDDYY